MNSFLQRETAKSDSTASSGQFTRLRSRRKSDLSPKEMVQSVFSYWDTDGDGCWNYEEALRMQRDTEGTELSKEDWEELCDHLGADCQRGLCLPHVIAMYDEPIYDADLLRDYTVLMVKKRMTESPPMRTSFLLPTSPTLHRFDTFEEVESRFGSTFRLRPLEPLLFADDKGESVRFEVANDQLQMSLGGTLPVSVGSVSMTGRGELVTSAGSVNVPSDEQGRVLHHLAHLAEVVGVPHNMKTADQVSNYQLQKRIAELELRLRQYESAANSSNAHSILAVVSIAGCIAAASTAIPNLPVMRSQFRGGRDMRSLEEETQTVLGTAERLLSTLQQVSPSSSRSQSIDPNTTDIANAYAISHRLGWDEGVGGRISLRAGSSMLSAPAAPLPHRSVTAPSVVQVPLHDPAATWELSLHRAAYQSRTDIECVWTIVETNTVALSLRGFAALSPPGWILRPLVHPSPIDPFDTTALASALSTHDILLLRGAGVLVAARSLPIAYHRAFLVWRAAQHVVAASVCVGREVVLPEATEEFCNAFAEKVGTSCAPLEPWGESQMTYAVTGLAEWRTPPRRDLRPPTASP